MRRLLLLALAASLLAGCNLLSLTPTSRVVRLRVAGIQAEPAEIGVGESTTLRSLLVHPQSPPPELGQIWFACVEAGSAAGCLGVDLESLLEAGNEEEPGEEPVDLLDVQFGVGESFVYTAQGPSLEEAWQQLEPEERVEGLTVLVSVNYVDRSNEELQALLGQLAVAVQAGDSELQESLGEEFASLLEDGLSAARRIVISDKSADEPGAVSCPTQELLPNNNPQLEGLLLHLDPEGDDSGFTLGPVTFVQPGSTLVLRPSISDETVEDYLYITTDGVTECRRETPYFAWLTNGGAYDSDYSFVADSEDLDEVAGRAKRNRLVLPSREQFGDSIDIWLVARDRRGGFAWDRWVLVPESE